MSLWLMVCSVCLLSWSCSGSGTDSSGVSDGAWNLVWSDEFDYQGLPDAEKWGYDVGTGQDGWGNKELQYYTDRSENAYIEDGSLVIEAREETFVGNSYTSARLKTEGLQSFRYGRIEARIMLPE